MTAHEGIKFFVKPHEATEVWARDHICPSGNLVENLHQVGVKTYGITLDVVRGGADGIMSLVRDCMDKGFDGVVYDAETPDDLAIYRPGYLSFGG